MLLNSFSHRPLRSIVIHIARPGLTGFWTDPTLAVFAGITLRCGQLSNHHLGGNQWRVQTYWSRWSCQKMGGKEIKTKHELWQDEPSSPILLPSQHSEEGPGREALLPVSCYLRELPVKGKYYSHSHSFIFHFSFWFLMTDTEKNNKLSNGNYFFQVSSESEWTEEHQEHFSSEAADGGPASWEQLPVHVLHR